MERPETGRRAGQGRRPWSGRGRPLDDHGVQQRVGLLDPLDPRADAPLVDWRELGVSELPTGTVTLLLADVEGSTKLWETQPDDVAAAIACLNQFVSEIIAAHGGVRLLEDWRIHDADA
jgi:class 3 adenylate cyclase